MSQPRYRCIPRPDEMRVLVEDLVVRTGCVTVCDLGGGANPLLTEEFIARHGLRYVLVDASEKELAWASEGYEKIVADLGSPDFVPFVRCDLAFSNFVLEHIADPEQFHRNVRSLLADGARAAHFFSTLYSLPFVINWVLPEALAARLAGFTLPGRQINGRQSVFPAKYRWCLGPVRRQFDRFERLGYEVERYTGYFGHSYFRRWKTLQTFEYKLASLLERHPVATVTSFAHIVLIKSA